jgi:hypothetical protein
MKTLKLILLMFLFAACLNRVYAQTTANYPPEQLKAAERLLQAADVGNTLQKSFASVIQTQAQQVPEDKRAAFIDVMNKFFAKYITMEAVTQGLVPIYASEYSTDELNKIADFLSTPAGKAMTEKEPDLMAKSMKWGQDAVQAHKDELEAMMKDAFGEK